MTYFVPRTAASGSLTAGVPAAQYPAGSYAFRTSILVLVLEPTVDNTAFVQSLARLIEAGIPGSQLRSGRISIGQPSQQRVPRENAQSLWDAFLTGGLWSIPAAAYGGLPAAENVQVAYEIGWAIGALGNIIIPDYVRSQWVTVDGVIDSPSAAVNTDTITNRIASALNETLRLRTPRAPYTMIQPSDAQVGESVIARTREDGACAGHRRLDKVIAAACTRLEAVAAQPVLRPHPPTTPMQPTAPTQTYPQQTVAQQTQRPSTASQHTRLPVDVYMPPPPPSGTPPWVYYAIGAIVVTGIAGLVVLDD
jgi:hypothetical protein